MVLDKTGPAAVEEPTKPQEYISQDEINALLGAEGKRQKALDEAAAAIRNGVAAVASKKPTPLITSNGPPPPKTVFKASALVPAKDKNGDILPGRFIATEAAAAREKLDSGQPLKPTQHPLVAAGFTRVPKSANGQATVYNPGNKNFVPFSQIPTKTKHAKFTHATSADGMEPKRLLQILLGEIAFRASGIGADPARYKEKKAEMAALLAKHPELKPATASDFK
jgi:hypothetical protein